jgi:hypothetical protein
VHPRGVVGDADHEGDADEPVGDADIQLPDRVGRHPRPHEINESEDRGGQSEGVYEYESGPYDLRRLSLTDGRPAWSYVWTDAAAVLESDWSADEFAAEHLPGFVVQVRAFIAGPAAARSAGGTAFRPHDPKVAR